MNQATQYTIDATGQSLGRIAVKVAELLRGKNRTDFVPYKAGTGTVTVTHFKNIKITGNKLEKKIYYRHSGYLGGLKQRTLKELIAKDPKEPLRKAVFGMLPATKLRNEQMKRLYIEL